MFANHANAWREILQRIFSDFPLQENVTPEWLVNPETGRHLKLDRYYQDVGIAFRFVGSMGKRKSPVSEQELEEAAHRDAVRDELCASAGVSLISINLYESEPRAVLQEIRSAISRSARLLAQGRETHAVKVERSERLAGAKKVCDSLAMRVRSIGDLAIYSELWEDRQFSDRAQDSAQMAAQPKQNPYAPHMRVRHEHFGNGAVTDVRREKSGDLVVVQFDDGSQRTFAVGLVLSKLVPIK